MTRSVRSLTLSTTASDNRLETNPNRKGWGITNEDTAITIRFHPTADSDGYPILPQSEKIFDVTTKEDPTDGMFFSSDSGTPTATIYEWFD